MKLQLKNCLPKEQQGWKINSCYHSRYENASASDTYVHHWAGPKRRPVVSAVCIRNCSIISLATVQDANSNIFVVLKTSTSGTRISARQVQGTWNRGHGFCASVSVFREEFQFPVHRGRRTIRARWRAAPKGAKGRARQESGDARRRAEVAAVHARTAGGGEADARRRENTWRRAIPPIFKPRRCDTCCPAPPKRVNINSVYQRSDIRRARFRPTTVHASCRSFAAVLVASRCSILFARTPLTGRTGKNQLHHAEIER